MKGKSKKRKNLKVYIPLAVIVLLILLGAFYWYRDYSRYVQTDDAYVSSDNISVSSKIIERIRQIYVEEGDTVKKGMLLIVLDSADIIAQRQQILSSIEQAKASKEQAEATYQLNIENSKIADIAWQRASEDFDRAKKQFEGGVIPKEQYDHLKKAEESAKAQLNASMATVNVSKKQIENAITSIKTAQAQLGVINVQLSNTKLYAPCDGVVAKRWLLPGDLAQTGQSILSINNTNKFWILVNLEETKMHHLYLHQKAIYSIDAFPGVTFTGEVFYIGTTTSAQFALIPPNNASGNFTKVTQRVPVKISIDSTLNQKNIHDFTFVTGMSAVVKIIKR